MLLKSLHADVDVIVFNTCNGHRRRPHSFEMESKRNLSQRAQCKHLPVHPNRVDWNVGTRLAPLCSGNNLAKDIKNLNLPFKKSC